MKCNKIREWNGFPNHWAWTRTERHNNSRQQYFYLLFLCLFKFMQLFPQATWFKSLTMSCWCSYGDYVVVLIWDGQKGLTNESSLSSPWTNNCGKFKNYSETNFCRTLCQCFEEHGKPNCFRSPGIPSSTSEVKESYLNAGPLFLNLEDW